ncbi:MAG: secondary thiamine-phosphate synthase enzyme YjbQ [Elusimicrobiota bacterium]|nr:secondary thiamine-phosphate synthase enzyme YjbQ [Elusimicrobiota bacterium]
MKVITARIHLSTKGNSEIVDITDKVQEELHKSRLSDGIVTVFVPGSTGAIGTMEYESGLIKDTSEMFSELVKETKKYLHNRSHLDGNATAHLRATLLGPSLTVPFEAGKLTLGTWQQIVFVDFDNRPRRREIVIKFIGRGRDE